MNCLPIQLGTCQKGQRTSKERKAHKQQCGNEEQQSGRHAWFTTGAGQSPGGE